MNPISAFFVRNIVVIFFLYGLAFFAMGLALALASRRASEFSFVRAIRPLAAFGISHGLHEWIEMFQKIATLTSGYTPSVLHEFIRLGILVFSFAALLAFGLLLLNAGSAEPKRVYLPLAGLIALWGGSVLVVAIIVRSPMEETIAMADVLARYSLGIPGGLLGTWAMMAQQRTFREHGMPQFGRDLVWCATALFLYGVIGQIFVRQTALVPSTVIHSALFLQWFGIPVQLFRGAMAAVLAVYMVRALNAFDLESQRRLEEANQAKLMAQEAALRTERSISNEMERLNQELRLTAHELSLLLDLSNLLVAPMSLPDRLHSVLQKIVDSLKFPEAGMILLARREAGGSQVRAVIGFDPAGEAGTAESPYQLALHLGEQCVARAMAVCRHLDGQVIEFSTLEGLEQQLCQRHLSPLTIISLPLTAGKKVIGSIVLGRLNVTGLTALSFSEFKLMLGMAQQLGLSLENARLYQEAQERESMLGELLHQVVGAQETERQRIARELHDATGQSLTAIALGLRGVEAMLASDSRVVTQIRELKTFGTQALGELRRIIADLRPSQLDDLGLVAALQWYVQEFEKRYSIATHFTAQGYRSRLPAEYETVLFRITQEALTNIAKHAAATRAEVNLEVFTTQIRLTIQDNGRGFNPQEVLHGSRSHGGWGLLGIQERTLLLGGQYEFNSEPGQGTCIRVRVPLIMETSDAKDKTVTGG